MTEYIDPDAIQVVRKPVVGYEGYYEVDQFGRVYAIDRVVHVEERRRTFDKFVHGKIIKQSTHSMGYKVVTLAKDGQLKSCYVHRLVAMAFIPNPDNLPIINHKDEDKTNNNVDNLEWCTCKYNSQYGSSRERISVKQKGRLITNEHRKKISDSLMRYYEKHVSPNLHRPSPFKKAVIATDDNGNETYYPSVNEAMVALGRRGNKSIIDACKNKIKKAHGFSWRYATENDC